ncbi:peptide-methionine (S)-S-oxide reductase [Photobacterium damselae]|uniref:Peptide-methionine (S)-S-oxide reductase n=1 Tax=Photobacterium damselae TaxID=38293 RepID=A0ACD3T1K4_PHODM|nr:peptide-methionine (S)-S-oxide reductase MsrA [Photobacterium damselae]RDL29625.1 peptide-methionine (S)-S-oxide reductase [Photobacterium damselae]TMX45107.1 peptide-methionine (S)-S-oxide reductase [Photobacterium damselae]TMX65897.1 peptide-methionine (S)-S-oxide reductase [Photobacterium damselae]TMX75349.1 peptide-methionine (S)-S-oxide reductase [Photobacterium damselae]
MLNDKQIKIDASNALAGRKNSIVPPAHHYVLQTPLDTVPNHCDFIILGMGCFWGAERLFWQVDGVYSTAVGYSGGYTENPTYQEVCSGQTGHAEVVKIVFDPSVVSLEQLLSLFWEKHNPTQGMRQGNDIGTQYRSVIYTHSSEQELAAISSRNRYQQALTKMGDDHLITTEIEPASMFYFAEEYHQQYLAKNPDGYCGLGGLGVCFPQ